MRELNPTEIKALFDQLVTAVGTHDAASTFLGISRQRVGQLISTANNDLPTLAQVFKLEQVCGQSIVLAAMARMVDGDASGDTMAAAVQATTASSAALATIHAAAADGVYSTGEVDNIQDRARETLEAAQRQFDAAMKMRPTLRVVA